MEIFFKKYKIRALKLIVYLLNCTLEPPKLRVREPLDPLGYLRIFKLTIEILKLKNDPDIDKNHDSLETIRINIS